MTYMGWILLLFCGIVQTAANLCLRAGVDRAGGFFFNIPTMSQSMMKLLSQPLFDIGVIFYALAAIIWFRIIATEQLSIAYPVLVSVTFILVTIGAVLIFQESMTWLKILGVLTIIVGIVIMSWSK
ncbi:MAG: hypothetical protein WC593_13775 [Methanoregula sp.]